jgi:hypothetical protein
LSIDTTTGMSAPPIAITMCTPKAQRDHGHHQQQRHAGAGRVRVEEPAPEQDHQHEARSG